MRRSKLVSVSSPQIQNLHFYRPPVSPATLPYNPTPNDLSASPVCPPMNNLSDLPAYQPPSNNLPAPPAYQPPSQEETSFYNPPSNAKSGFVLPASST